MSEREPVGAPPRWSTGPGPDEDQPTSAEAPRTRASFLSELPVLVLIAFVLALLMKTFLVQAFFIPSSSMEPTLLVDDRVLVNKLAHVLREPRRGEVVVFSERGVDRGPEPDVGIVERALRSVGSGLGLVPATEKDFIKRIIGLPGDTVEMRDGTVYVNGRSIPEAPTSEGGYLSARDPSPFGPFTVPPGEYFMMGDNRPSSSDSRGTLGTIPRDHIVGRAFVTIWPLGRLRLLPINDYGEPGAAQASPGGAVVPLRLAS